MGPTDGAKTARARVRGDAVMLQLVLIVLVMAVLFRSVRRLLRTTVGMVVGALVLFLIVVAVSRQF